jgi:hypothetical protein
MNGFSMSSTLWAMHPDYLSAFLKQGNLEAMLPDALKSLAGAFGGDRAAAKQNDDPIREGATAILPIRGTSDRKASRWDFGRTSPISSPIAFASSPRIQRSARSSSISRALEACLRHLGGRRRDLRGARCEAGRRGRQARTPSPPPIGSRRNASAFYASPSAEVGSVGVRGGHVDMSRPRGQDRDENDARRVRSRQDRRLTPTRRSPKRIAPSIQAEIDEMNQAFVAAIARGRGIQASEVPGIHGKGATFSAKRGRSSGA